MLLGNLNAQHKKWGNVTNNRGNVLLSWAMKYGWQITVPAERTCTSDNGTSDPDVFLIRNIMFSQADLKVDAWSEIRDHQVASRTVTVTQDSNRDRPVKICKSSSKKNVRTFAKALGYRQFMTPLLENKTALSKTPDQFETLYKALKQIILQPCNGPHNRSPSASSPFGAAPSTKKKKNGPGYTSVPPKRVTYITGQLINYRTKTSSGW